MRIKNLYYLLHLFKIMLLYKVRYIYGLYLFILVLQASFFGVIYISKVGPTYLAKKMLPKIVFSIPFECIIMVFKFAQVLFLNLVPTLGMPSQAEEADNHL